MIEKAHLEDTELFYESRGEGGPCVIVMTEMSMLEGDMKTLDIVMNSPSLSEKAFSVCLAAVGDWMDSLSPWEAATSLQTFGGNGQKTLDTLISRVIPFLSDRLSSSSFMIAGYSLAGLFALWAACRTEVFTACASCSGSLWFPGFEDSFDTKLLPDGENVFLSLGGKESKSPDEVMATVADVHERIYRKLKNDGRISRVTYEKNPGGHFKDPEKRLARGIEWILQSAR